MQARLRHLGLSGCAVCAETVGARAGVAAAAVAGVGAGAGAGAGSLSCRMELMKVVGESGVSCGIVPTSTSTGHTSSNSESWVVVGLDGSSLMCTRGLVLSLPKKKNPH